MCEWVCGWKRERIISMNHIRKNFERLKCFFLSNHKNKAIDFAIGRRIWYSLNVRLRADIFSKCYTNHHQTIGSTVWKYIWCWFFLWQILLFFFFFSCSHCCWFLFDCFVYGTFWSCAAILVVSRSHSPYSIAVTLFLVSSENVFLTK